MNLIIEKISRQLIENTKALALVHYLRNSSRKKPVLRESILKGFGDDANHILYTLIGLGAITYPSPKSKQVFLTQEGKEALTFLMNWANRVREEKISETGFISVTSKPLRISNIKIEVGNIEVPQQPRADSFLGFTIRKEESFAAKDRFRVLSETQMSPVQDLVKEIRVPTTTQAESVVNIIEGTNVQDTTQGKSWQR